ncbi:hypothetical protein GCM10010401_21950 [Rarobacter faecitabidus]|uniref:Uncharacterized protein n=1 Tax=Rarobacter faecitabidus TaxID=13243 RepID=A0A542ZVR6_RARFA|nr:hypothetical protein [Rarobacter faecitabidus]TQL64399.1 hypothetical protein FB461_0901 [Rarobacter faecitabidus]
MWFWIWLALVVAALAFMVGVLWWLWQRGRHLAEVMGEASSVLGEAFDQDFADEFTTARPVTALGDVQAAREYREERRAAKFARRRAKFDRHRERWRSWLRFNE